MKVRASVKVICKDCKVIKTEDDYFSYLSQYYAEDAEYVAKLKNIISNEGLKCKFNQ